MAYYQEKLLSGTPGGSGTSLINVASGSLPLNMINRAVTYDGQPKDLANPKVKLAGNNHIVIGSILGFANNKLQIAVDGWDIKFINGTGSIMDPGARILGAAYGGELGFIKEESLGLPGTYLQTQIESALDNMLKSRGAVLHGGEAGQPGSAIVRVTMRFGS